MFIATECNKQRKHNCIIGEIQFLFKRMLEFKAMDHCLYAIERAKEFIDDLSEYISNIVAHQIIWEQTFKNAAKNRI